MTIISTDRTTAFVFDHASQILIVKASAVLAVEGDYAVADANFGVEPYVGCIVTNYGAIYSNYTGVVMKGADATVFNHASGFIFGVEGVYLGGRDGHLENLGYVYGSDIGVELAATSTSVVNSGVISADNIAIQVSTAVSAAIENSGTIRGDAFAILVTPNTPYVALVNSGNIIGEVYLGNASASSVRNSGVIEGSIGFGNSDDRYDGRGGQAGEVEGGDGADTLIGGAGDDTLTGGIGADRMKGGAGADVFAYGRVVESQGALADLIRGWDAADAFDLSSIDANAKKPGVQALAFGGQIAATDPVGEDMVQYYRKGGDTYVVADINGDGKADLAVRIVGAYTLDAGDFVL